MRYTILCLFALIAMASCKKEDNSVNDSSKPAVTAILATGSWRVSYFHEGSSDNTSNFNGYSFVFNGNGVMTATSSGGSVNGSWSFDDSNAEIHFSIGNSTPLSDLNKGWIIVSKTGTELVLKDDDSAHSEEVHFTRI